MDIQYPFAVVDSLEATPNRILQRYDHIHDRQGNCLKNRGGERCGESVRDNDPINHPQHYGGDTVYETIKVIEAWGLNFNLGNAVKYISRAEHKHNAKEDLKKAVWYLEREIAKYTNG